MGGNSGTVAEDEALDEDAFVAGVVVTFALFGCQPMPLTDELAVDVDPPTTTRNLAFSTNMPLG